MPRARVRVLLGLTACSAGIRPKRTDARAAIANANSVTRRSSFGCMNAGVAVPASISLAATKLTPSAAAVPSAASIRLSVSNCRTSLRRVAPTDRRTAISRSRENPRARISVARFAHAAISTIAVKALAIAMLSASNRDEPSRRDRPQPFVLPRRVSSALPERRRRRSQAVLDRAEAQPGLDAREERDGIVRVAGQQVAAGKGVRLFRDGDPCLRRAARQADERCRRDARHRERPAVDPDGSPGDAADRRRTGFATAKTPGRRPARHPARRPRRVEQPAERRNRAELREVVGRDELHRNGPRGVGLQRDERPHEPHRGGEHGVVRRVEVEGRVGERRGLPCGLRRLNLTSESGSLTGSGLSARLFRI